MPSNTSSCTENDLYSYRERFTEAKQESIFVAQKWGLVVKYPVIRIIKTKFDGLQMVID